MAFNASDIFKFLKALKKNNNKPWFDEHKDQYQAAREEFIAFVDLVIQDIAVFDKGLEGVEAKKCIFRINRDIRFSKDKTPYKTNFGASINAGGKKGAGAGYYLHLEPGKSFLAGGKYMPDAVQLKKIRQEIDYNPKDLLKILSEKSFKTYFGGLYEEDKLANPPKEYSKDHPQIEILKLKSFLAVHDMKDDVVTSDQFRGYCKKVYKAMYPLNKFLNQAMELKGSDE